MIYMKTSRLNCDVSVLGLGCEHLVKHTYQELEPVVRAALDGGINILDVFMPEPDVRTNIGKALGRDRKKVLIQGHIGAVIVDGQSTQSRVTAPAKSYFEDLMKRLKTDYIDIGYLHFIDNEIEYKKVFEGDIIEYALKLKQEGVIRAIGISTHSTEIALKAVATGLIDVLMFPINAAFDLMPKGQSIYDIFKKETHHVENWYQMEAGRQELYTMCENGGIAVIAMKPLGGGMLLNAGLSPFGNPMTVNQCVGYALSNSSVTTAMVGCRNPAEVAELLGFMQASDEEKDFFKVLSKAPISDIMGKCMYCNHCLPCPANIDIAAVIKCKDLASFKGTSPLGIIADHYRSLERNAEDCIECGVCEAKCPNEVKIVENMLKTRTLFGGK